MSFLVVRTLLVILLVLCVVFVWRVGRRYPALSILAAAAATVLGVVLFRGGLVATAVIVAACLLLMYSSRPRQ